MNPRRLYRSSHDRQLAGVAAGMAEYLEVDPTLVRVLWILSAFFGGFTIVLYIILAFVIPLEPAAGPGSGPWQKAGPAWGTPPTPAGGTETAGDDSGSAGEPGAASPPDGGTANAAWATPAAWATRAPDRRPARREGRGSLYLGVVLVVFGAIALANALLPGWAGVAALGPAFLVALGVGLLVASVRRGAFDR